MEIKEKKRHHFVPVCYLKNFARIAENKCKKTKYFVSIYDKMNDEEGINISVENICVNNNLYSLNSDKKEEIEYVENFFANTIEKDYPKFYKIITTNDTYSISMEERELIIITVLSLYLRNVFWLNNFNVFSNKLSKYYCCLEKESIKYKLGDRIFSFKSKTLDEINFADKCSNRAAFVEVMLEMTYGLLESHYSDLIIIQNCSPNENYITSDHPVVCKNISGSLRLPINHRQILTIMPNHKNDFHDLSKLFRINSGLTSRIYNLFQFENANRFLISNDLENIKQSKNDFIISKSL